MTPNERRRAERRLVFPLDVEGLRACLAKPRDTDEMVAAIFGRDDYVPTFRQEIIDWCSGRGQKHQHDYDDYLCEFPSPRWCWTARVFEGLGDEEFAAAVSAARAEAVAKRQALPTAGGSN